MSYQRMKEEEKRLREEIRELMVKAKRADEQEDKRYGKDRRGGEISLDQLFHLRPAPGYADYRTPIRGLYNASSSTHGGGGGVNGIPGLQAFRQAKRDRAIRG
jgi:phytoene dehydrogenase-like protein